MAQTIKFELNNKIYYYPYVIVNTKSSFWGDSTIIRGDFVSVFEFLELEKRTYTIPIKINDVQLSIAISPSFQSDTIYQAIIRVGNYGMYFFSKSDEVQKENYFFGNCLVYNIATDEWGMRSGGQAFTPQQDGKFFPLKMIFSKELYATNNLELDYKNLKANNIYRAIYAQQISQIKSNYSTSQFPVDVTACTYIMKYVNYTIPTYPGNTSESDNTDPIPGDENNDSDPIDKPSTPTFDGTNTGFTVIYNPSVTELRSLAYFLWTTDWDNILKKALGNAIDYLISLKMLFCPVTAGTTKEIWLGAIETGVTAGKVTQQFTDVDCGSLSLAEYFGSFADYAPYTKIQIYLPFIGYRDLDVDDVMNATVSVSYRIDVYTGACIAYISASKTIQGTNLNSILYQFDGNCAMELPFNSNSMAQYVNAIMNTVASSALSLAATSGVASTKPKSTDMINKAESHFVLGSLTPLANGMLDIISAKPNVQRAGSLGGATAAMCVKKPYIIIHRPIAQMPSNYQHYQGIPLNKTQQLSNVTGYTILSQVFFSSTSALDEEIEMITALLKNGVIF